MILISRSIVILSLIFSVSNADSNNTQNESSYIDATHRAFSKKVLEWSDAIDTKVNSWIKNDEKNSTDIITDLPMNTLEDKSNYIDSFFQNDKYLNETDNTYVRVRTGTYLQSKDSTDFDLSLSAQLPFRKSRKNLKIFIEDITLDNAENVIKDNPDQAPDIGIHYFRPEKYGINSKYSLGFRGIHPFARARYNKPIYANDWLIDMVQSFQYSTKDKFEEETNIYFDRELLEKKLIRLQLHRKTQQETDGMDYVFSAQYYCCRKKNTGLMFSQTFIGNSKYHYLVDNGTEFPQTKEYGGINNYVTALTWRRNVWRKWFYFEVNPAVSFQKQYNYDPNYMFRLSFDFYFGKYN